MPLCVLRSFSCGFHRSTLTYGLACFIFRFLRRPLLELCQYQHIKLPNTALTMSYLAKHPSHYAALTGFVNFLNEHYGTDIPYRQIKNSKFLRNKSKANLENEIMKIIATRDQTDILKWAKLCLRYFHAMNYLQAKKIKKNQIVIIQDGYEIQINNAIYWIPHMALSH